MATFNQQFNKELEDLKLFKENSCTEEKCAELKALLEAGKDLPEGYRQSVENENFFYEQKGRVGLSKEEILTIVQLQQAKNIKTIKSCAVFITALVAVSLIASVVIFASLPGMFSNVFSSLFY